MSGTIRTRIGQTRRLLRLASPAVESSLAEETAKPIKQRSDQELIDDSNVLVGVRNPFVKYYNTLLADHKTFLELRSADPSEEEEFQRYITKKGDYTKELTAASELLKKLDAKIEELLSEGKSRTLDVPEENDDALTTSTDSSAPKTTVAPPVPSPRTTIKQNEQANTQRNLLDQSPATANQSGISGIIDTVANALQGAVLSTSFEKVDEEKETKLPPSPPPPQPPQVVYLPSDTSSAFVTAALMGKTLPSFNGDILEWPEFNESFLSLIANGRITGSDKLSLLKMCLRGEAAEIITGLPKLDRNFDTAMLLLEKEYDKPVLRHHSLLTRIRTLPTCDARNVRPFYLKLNTLIHQLLPNGMEESKDLLVNMVTAKLPLGMQTRVLKESTRRPDFGVYSVLSILAEAVDDEKIEREILQSSRFERRQEKTTHSTDQSNHNSPSTPEKHRASRPQKEYTNRFSARPPYCKLCKGQHKVDYCTTYTTPEDRKTAVIQQKLCMNCLLSNHKTHECRNNFRCLNCKQNHHSSICTKPAQNPAATTRQHDSPIHRPPKPGQNVNKNQNSKHYSNNRRPQQQTNCALTEELFEEKTMTVQTSHIPPIIDISNRPHNQPLLCLECVLHSPTNPTRSLKATVIFDTASTCSYITTELAKQLELPLIESQRIATRVFGKEKSSQRTVGIFPIGVTMNDGTQRNIATLSSPFICGAIDWLKKENSSISPTSSTPSLLIGMDYFLEFFLGDSFSMSRTDEGTYILSTPIGEIATKTQVNRRSLLSTIMVNPSVAPDAIPDLAKLEEMVKNFFSVEMIGVADSPETDDDDKRGLAHFLANITFNESEKRYYVALPFREENPKLPTNFGLAFRRLIINSTSLAQKPENIAKYNAIFEEQLKENILEKVPDEELFKKEGVHYLSHFGIVKETSNTTKLRAVLDGSAHTKENPSLNHCIYRGPVILPDLFGTLIRSRTTPILISADIAKAFLQVGLHVSSRDYTRLLWLKDITKPPSMENLVVFRFCRVPFGLNCSPFLLAGTIQHHLILNPNEWAEFIRDIYVDNYFGHANSIEQGTRQFHEVRDFFKNASFNLREFVSNNTQLNELFTSHNAAAADLKRAKILGVHWNTETDSYSVPLLKTPADDTKWTKRLILRHLNGFFDPMGLKAPATLPLKIFFQQLWKMGADWDTTLTNDYLNEWKSLLTQFHTPSLFSSIPRLAIPHSIDGCSIELHIFVDASQYAYAAVCYLVCRQPDGYGSSSLLASKARVAPVNCVVNIPRMELLGNLLGAILGNHIIKELTTCNPTQVMMWTDSMIALCWIRNESKKELPVFIRNRAIKINSLLPTATFNHIDGPLNPADVASRGCSSDDLENHPLWWKGPPFLTQPSDTWSPQPDLGTHSVRETTLAIATDSTEPIHDPIPPLIDASRFGSWTRMVNAMIMVLLFIRRLKKIPENTSRVSLHRRAEQLLFRMSQMEFPPSQHLMNQLRMFECKKTKLWRCRGRIDNAQIAIEAKCPIYLPRESPITRLFILYNHNRNIGSS